MAFKNWIYNALFPLSKEERELLEKFYIVGGMSDAHIKPEEIPALQKLIKRGYIQIKEEEADSPATSLQK